MPFLFLLLPLAEIAVFIIVGQAIGLLATLALILASSALGLSLVKSAGTLTLDRLRRGRDDPAAILVDGGAKMAAGLLFLISGFLTDLAALVLLVPAVRRRLDKRVGKPGPTIIEGEFIQVGPGSESGATIHLDRR